MNLNSKGKTMVYLEIVDQYKKYIKLNILKHGDKLPSVRQIASDLGINPNTVNRSFQILEEEGYIKVYPKKGAYVTYSVDTEREQTRYWKEQIKILKDSGLTITKLKEIANDVYGGDGK